MSTKKKDELEYGQGTNNSIIFNNSSAHLTEEQLKMRIQMDAQKASKGSGQGSQFTIGSVRAANYKK